MVHHVTEYGLFITSGLLLLTDREFVEICLQECAYDHVTIYDGASADVKTLGLFCGSKLPHPVVASQNQMYVVFKSDGSVQRKGFLATHSTGS